MRFWRFVNLEQAFIFLINSDVLGMKKLSLSSYCLTTVIQCKRKASFSSELTYLLRPLYLHRLATSRSYALKIRYFEATAAWTFKRPKDIQMSLNYHKAKHYALMVIMPYFVLSFNKRTINQAKKKQNKNFFEWGVGSSKLLLVIQKKSYSETLEEKTGIPRTFSKCHKY